MSKLSLVVLVLSVAFGGFLLGRTTSTSPQTTDGPDGTTGFRPEPTPATEILVPREHRSILRFFAGADEKSLPERGVLGGRMIATTVAFPKDFSGTPGDHFFVVGDDGHILETWTYEIRKGGAWRHTETRDGLKPVDLQRNREDFDVYLWRPARYVPATPDM